MMVWYNQRFDLIGLGVWASQWQDPTSDIIRIRIQTGAQWGRARTVKEWKKVDWVLIGEY